MAPKQTSYQAKRNFRSSPEPKWRRATSSESIRKKSAKGRLFVIQKHDATRLHYDLRLEINGALASWAVPKGIPMEHGAKHLAIKVEDHPLDYADFEGTIPPGNYGAGTVMLWDRGLYEVRENDPAAALEKGRLSLVFAGEKLTGDWILTRTRSGNDKEHWLLLKGKANEHKITPEEDDRSVASGRSLAEIAEGRTASAGSAAGSVRSKFENHPSLADLPSAAPGFVSPMKPHLSQGLPTRGDWIYEIKFDGYRMIAIKEGGETTLYSRNHKEISADFTDIRDAVAALPVDRAVLDGEVVALLESGLSSFQLLQNRGRPGGPDAPPLYGYFFDLLHLDGRDTTGLPLEQRKELLRELLDGVPYPLRFSAGIDTDPEALLAHAREVGLEGLIAKEAGSRYQVGRRSRSWLKIKLHHEQEFVVGGYTEPKGSRSHFGSLLLGVYKGKQLHYVGRAGTGFDERSLQKAFDTFQPLRTAEPPFVNLPAPRRSSFGTGLTASEMKRCVWLKPRLVCQVRFSEWTSDESIRHPVFIAFRDDKSPREVRRE